MLNYTPTPNSQQNMPSALDIATELAICDCNLQLAAERLSSRYQQELTDAALLAALSDDTNAQELLFRQLKLKATIDAYKNMNIASVIITASLNLYEPADHIKAYSSFAALFRDLAANNTTNINFNQTNYMDRLLSIVPADVREAITILSRDPKEQTTESDPDEQTDQPVAIDSANPNSNSLLLMAKSNILPVRSDKRITRLKSMATPNE